MQILVGLLAGTAVGRVTNSRAAAAMHAGASLSLVDRPRRPRLVAL